MDFTCAFCRTRVPINPMFDQSKCPGCNQILNNGLDRFFRKDLENSQYWMDRPRSVMARAASYSNRIYDFSSHGTPMKLDDVEKKVRRRFGAQASGTAQALWASGRGYLDLWDGGIGCMIVRVRGVTGGYKWSYLYVVFRGSRGSDNPFKAGRDVNDLSIGLDWRANLDNEQIRVDWGPPDAKVHQGFYAIYMSIRNDLKTALSEAIRHENREGYKPVIIITGHSLGAGLTQICGHDFHFTGFATPGIFPFCPPRAGNLGFVRSFNAELCDKEMFYPSEKRHYSRAVSSVQGMDLVSISQKRSSRTPLTEKDGKFIDEAKFVRQGLYAIGWKHEDLSKIIKAEEQLLYGANPSPYVRKWRQIQKQVSYYHIKNLFLIQLGGFHHPGWAESNAYSRFH